MGYSVAYSETQIVQDRTQEEWKDKSGPCVPF